MHFFTSAWHLAQKRQKKHYQKKKNFWKRKGKKEEGKKIVESTRRTERERKGNGARLEKKGRGDKRKI